jgi:hypothetical protein
MTDLFRNKLKINLFNYIIFVTYPNQTWPNTTFMEEKNIIWISCI